MPEVDPVTAGTIDAVRPYTMTSPERVSALCEAVRYIQRFKIPGAVVECGVWRGGSVMAIVRTLIQVGCTDRDVYLFDTFEGMTSPGEEDRAFDGTAAVDLMQQHERATGESLCQASMAEVKANLERTRYPASRLHFVPGPVEATIPGEAPPLIALLRLDTDWYESTRHELEHLLPRLTRNGVLVIDDYGHWQGARRAVDEFLDSTDRPILLNRIDYTGRVATCP